jgi:hypothetical protein
VPVALQARGRPSQRVFQRWRPRDASRRRELIAVLLNVVPALLAVAALALVAPASDWSDPVLIAALAAASAIAYGAEARLKAANRVFFGANLVIALVALAACGPLPALLVWLVPDLITRFVLRTEGRLSPGFVANFGSYAVAVLAGAGLLALAGSPSGPAVAPALYATGIAMWALNFCFARLTYAPFYQGYRPIALIRDEFADLGPAVLGMLLVGVIAAVLVEVVGVVALAPLALIILVPQAALERIVAAESAACLHRPEATRLYAAAIADVLDVPRAERRELACAADLLAPSSDPIAAEDIDWGGADHSRIAYLVLHSSERWTGGGRPAGLSGEAIPPSSRILAVATAWAGLTAAGTPEVSQADAILALAAQSGRAFDPTIVDAAARVVGDEEGFARRPDFQPQLHRLPVPRSVRRVALPLVLPRLVDQQA